MAGTEYAVRINMKEGGLEVAGPDKEWVDAKLAQLSPVYRDYRGQETDDSGTGADGAEPKRKRSRKSRPAGQPADEASGTSRRPRGTGGRPAINPALREQLTGEVKTKFSEYISARRKAWDKAQAAQAAIIAAFLQDELGITGVDQHDVYTVYSVMGERSPGNIRSQLTNAQQRSRYFGGRSDGKFTLSHAGENFARFDSLDGSEDGES